MNTLRDIYSSTLLLGACFFTLLELSLHTHYAQADSIIRAEIPMDLSSFGSQVKVHNDLLLIAAKEYNNSQGMVQCVNLKTNETTSLSIQSPDGIGGKLGWYMDINDEYIVLSAPYETSGQGSVYVGKRQNGSIPSSFQRITSPDPATSDYFGRCVKIQGNRLLIGEPGDDLVANNGGVLHVYVLNSENEWAYEGRHAPNIQYANDFFPLEINSTPGRVCVGTRYRKQNGYTQSGGAWVYQLGPEGLSAPQELLHSQPENYDWFGQNIAMDDQRIVIGACRDKREDTSGIEAGSVRIFEQGPNGVWFESDVLTNPDTEENDRFGASVALQGDRILIGAVGEDPEGVNAAGRVHFYEKTSQDWRPIERLMAKPLTELASTGTSCAFGPNGEFIAGAPGYTYSNEILREGIVFIWNSLIPCEGDFNGDNIVDGADLAVILADWNGTGAADLNANGTVDSADLGLLLSMWGFCE